MKGILIPMDFCEAPFPEANAPGYGGEPVNEC